MVVEIHVRELAGFPDISGAHELSWSYILDAVFADAYHAGVDRLTCTLPTKALATAVQLRADLTQVVERPAGGTAVAELTGGAPPVELPDRLYALSFGAAAPRRLRAGPTVRPAMALSTSLSVFTLPARLWGVPLRLFAALRRPDLYDRASFAMRRDFARTDHVPAYYHLSVWSRE